MLIVMVGVGALILVWGERQRQKADSAELGFPGLQEQLRCARTLRRPQTADRRCGGEGEMYDAGGYPGGINVRLYQRLDNGSWMPATLTRGTGPDLYGNHQKR